MEKQWHLGNRPGKVIYNEIYRLVRRKLLENEIKDENSNSEVFQDVGF